MASSNYDFRQFQAELAALDKDASPKKAEPPVAPEAPPAPAKKRGRPNKKAEAEARLAQIRDEFLALRAKYDLTVADVVAFFPEEEGVAYLQALLAQPQPRRRRKKTDAE